MQNEEIDDKGYTLGEWETMDLSKLYNKTFGVAHGTGKPTSAQFHCSTLLAPLTFEEMVGAVAQILQTQQLHAKVFVLRNDSSIKMEMLDPNTIDYIEAKYQDILVERIFLKDEEVEYTCEATLLEAKDESDPGPR